MTKSVKQTPNKQEGNNEESKKLEVQIETIGDMKTIKQKRTKQTNNKQQTMTSTQNTGVVSNTNTTTDATLTKIKSKSSKESKDSEKNMNTQKKQLQMEEENIVDQKNETTEQNESEFRFLKKLLSVQNEVKTMKDSLSNLALTLKKLESVYNSDIKKIKKSRPKRNSRPEPTGFNKPKEIPEKLAKFIGVETGTQLSGPQITKRIWKVLEDKGLLYSEDKRIFRTNSEISKLFGIPNSVNESTYHKDKNGFNFCNLQKYIANALNQA